MEYNREKVIITVLLSDTWLFQTLGLAQSYKSILISVLTTAEHCYATVAIAIKWVMEELKYYLAAWHFTLVHGKG